MIYSPSRHRRMRSTNIAHATAVAERKPRCPVPAHTRNNTPLAPLTALATVLALTPALASAVDANWIGTDGNYATATNWDTDPLIPLNNGVTYDVFINGNGNSITYNDGAPGAVDSLNLGAGVTFLTDLEFSAFASATTIANDATIIVEDQSTLALGGGNLDRSNLIVRKGFLGTGGSQLTTAITSWTGTNGFNLDRSFTADGAGSLLDLSSITTLERNGGTSSADLSINATDGGEVRLTNISAFDDNVSGVNGRLIIGANGAGSRMDLANVTALSNASITVQDGGDYSGQLTTLSDRSQLLKRGSDDADGDGIDMIDLSQLVDAADTTFITEDGAMLDLGTTNIDRTDLIARRGFLGAGGAQITTAVTSWSGTDGFNLDREFSADGAGSLVDLSSITALERNGGTTSSVLSIRATAGGEVRLGNITAIDDNASGVSGRVVIEATGAGSRMDLANVTALSNAAIAVQDGGDYIGQLTTLSERSQLLKRGSDDADGDGIDMIDLSQLVDAGDTTFIAEDGAMLDLGTTNINRTDLIARRGFQGAGGAQITTDATSWSGTDGFNLDREFSADGAGSLLDLSSLTALERNGGTTSSVLSIRATAGGEVRLDNIMAIDDNVSGVSGRVVIDANGAGSRIDLSNVSSLDNTAITVEDGGDYIGQLTTLSGRSQLLKHGADDADGDGIDMIDLSQLVDAGDTTFIAEDGAMLNLGTTNIDRTDLIARRGFLGAGGAQITTGVTSWAGTNGFNLDREFMAEGAGSLVDLSSITSLERTGGTTSAGLLIRARDGGEVRLNNLTAFADNLSGINGRIAIEAEDAGSLVDLSSVTALVTANVTIGASAGVALDQLGSFDDGTLELTASAAAANDLHVADSFVLGSNGILEVAGSTAAVVIGPGTPAGAADGSVTIAAGGMLSGTGTVIGDLVNGGHLAPGSSAGVFTVEGDYEQMTGALLALEIGGLLAGDEFDVLDITGAATLGGEIEVNLLSGFVPSMGDSVVFLEAAGGVSGIFDSLLCSNCGDTTFELVYGATSVSLNAVAAPVPLPAPVWLLGTALAGLVARRRSAA